MKIRCNTCGRETEIDELKYKPDKVVEVECKACGEFLEVLIPHREIKKRIRARIKPENKPKKKDKIDNVEEVKSESIEKVSNKSTTTKSKAVPKKVAGDAKTDMDQISSTVTQIKEKSNKRVTKSPAEKKKEPTKNSKTNRVEESSSVPIRRPNNHNTGSGCMVRTIWLSIFCILLIGLVVWWIVR